MSAGSVFIGQKHSRGVQGQKTVARINFKNIDVTSASRNLLGKNHIPANTLSPLTLGPVADKEGNVVLTFEAFWQHSKYWPTAAHLDGEGAPTQKWFEFRAKGFKLTKGKRRPLPLRQYGRPTGAVYNSQIYTGSDGYVQSRKDVYVPIYANLIKDLPAIAALKQMVKNGESVMIVDGDGPPRDIYPDGMEMTKENWQKMLNDSRFPFGHGYVVAAVVAGLDLPELTAEAAAIHLNPFTLKRTRDSISDDDAEKEEEEEEKTRNLCKMIAKK